MMAFLHQLKWQLLILYRNRLITISVVITLMYGLLFYFIKGLPNVEPFLTLLIYNDPAIIGMFFVGLGVIMESNSNVLPALFVTPVNIHSYLISRIVSLSLVGWACAAGMTAAMLGIDLDWMLFSAGVLGTCIIFSMAGFLIVSFTVEFLPFMLRSIPVLLLLSLPLLNYFGVSDQALFNYMPIMGPLSLMVSSFSSASELPGLLFSSIASIIWIGILYGVVYRIFVKRMILKE